MYCFCQEHNIESDAIKPDARFFANPQSTWPAAKKNKKTIPIGYKKSMDDDIQDHVCIRTFTLF